MLGQQEHGLADARVVAGLLRGDPAGLIERAEGLRPITVQGPGPGDVDPVASGAGWLLVLRDLLSHPRQSAFAPTPQKAFTAAGAPIWWTRVATVNTNHFKLRRDRTPRARPALVIWEAEQSA